MQGFFKENVRYLVWICRDQISLIVARQSTENSCFSFGNTVLQPARPAVTLFSVIPVGMFRMNPHFSVLPINENDHERKVNTADNARLDISVRGLWNSCEKTFFDIRITHPTSQSYSAKSLAEIYQPHEKEKKDKHNHRVIHTDKPSCNPLVFTTSGGMATECNRVKRLAKK